MLDVISKNSDNIVAMFVMMENSRFKEIVYDYLTNHYLRIFLDINLRELHLLHFEKIFLQNYDISQICDPYFKQARKLCL